MVLGSPLRQLLPSAWRRPCATGRRAQELPVAQLMAGLVVATIAFGLLTDCRCTPDSLGRERCPATRLRGLALGEDH